MSFQNHNYSGVANILKETRNKHLWNLNAVYVPVWSVNGSTFTPGRRGLSFVGLYALHSDVKGEKEREINQMVKSTV